MNKLDELQKLCDEATNGPWEPNEGQLQNVGYCHFRYATGPQINYLDSDKLGTREYGEDKAKFNAQVTSDAKFIAAARTYMPLLVKLARSAELMRFYCLANDASTENMIRRFDGARAALEQEK